MKTLGLIGFPLTHSFSPSYFAQKFKALNITDWQYLLFELENIDLLPQIINETPNLVGLNVTIPYKEKVISYCTRLTSEAQKIGAVNFLEIIKMNSQLEIIGHNTDWIGFSESLQQWYEPSIKNALILGNGGAAKAIIYSLEKLKIPYKITARKIENNTDFLAIHSISEKEFQTFDLIINCTPIGTFNHKESLFLLPFNAIQHYQFYYDLVYNPTETEMMKIFANKGAKVKNGYEMLKIQADESWNVVKAF